MSRLLGESPDWDLPAFLLEIADNLAIFGTIIFAARMVIWREVVSLYSRFHGWNL